MPTMNSSPDPLLRELAALGDSPLSLQKIADVADLQDRRTQFIIRNILGAEPCQNCRLWEFARAFDMMAGLGLLREDKRAISFGSGREILLYAVAQRCAHLTATDLYTADTHWLEARAADASAFVLAGAPYPIDPARLSALSMDAREIAFPDASFDFAYSISSMEHFGNDEDMLRHLREVRRVLRPAGHYILTTETCFLPDSRRSVGNYAFIIPHLLRLIAEAGLSLAPVVDARISQQRENVGVQYADTVDYGVAQRLEQSLIWRELGGTVQGPVCLALSPQPASAPTVLGWAESAAWLHSRQRARTAERYSDWARLNPFCFIVDPAQRWCDLWRGAQDGTPPQLLFSTQYAFYDDAEMEARVTLAALPEDAAEGRLLLAVHEMLIADPTQVVLRHLEPEAALGDARVVHRRFRFRTRAGHAYAILGQRASETMPVLASVDVVVRRVPAGA